MNSYERVFHRMEGLETDRLPNLCLVMSLAAKEMGVPYKKFVTDYRLLAEGMKICYEKYHLDVLCVCSDPMREAEGLGTKIIMPEDDVPYPAEKLIQDICQISHVKIADPISSRRMYDRIEAVGLLKEYGKKEIPVVGWVEGSVAESCDLMDMSEFLCSMLDEPEATHELLQLCMEQSALFAIEQIKAGADIIGIGDAASSLIGPGLYEAFALPYQKKLIERIHGEGAKVKLHICGDLNPVLHLVAETKADIVDLDHMVDLQKAGEVFPENMCISGNFDPVEILLQGTKETVAKAVHGCIRFGRNHRNMIAGGCEVPKFTPEENLLTVHQTLKADGTL